jgi:hypothetical protein
MLARPFASDTVSARGLQVEVLRGRERGRVSCICASSCRRCAQRNDPRRDAMIVGAHGA